MKISEIDAAETSAIHQGFNVTIEEFADAIIAANEYAQTYKDEKSIPKGYF